MCLDTWPGRALPFSVPSFPTAEMSSVETAPQIGVYLFTWPESLHPPEVLRVTEVLSSVQSYKILPATGADALRDSPHGPSEDSSLSCHRGVDPWGSLETPSHAQFLHTVGAL